MSVDGRVLDVKDTLDDLIAQLSLPIAFFIHGIHGNLASLAKSNDASEGKAVSDVFGSAVPCSSTKGWTGHLLGAAGITEAVIGMLAVEHGFMPGSVNTQRLDPAIAVNYQIESREGKIDRVLSNSFGFGGSNCSLILGRKS